MTLSVSGHAEYLDFTSPKSITTGAADTIIVANIAIRKNPSISVTSISSAAGLTWTKRHGHSWAGAQADSRHEVWWARAPSASTAETITINLSGSPDRFSVTMTMVEGVYDPTAPWDTNGSLPAVATDAPAGVSNASVGGVSTSSSDTILFGFYGRDADSTLVTPGTGFTDCGKIQGGFGFDKAATFTEYKIVSSAQSSVTVAFPAAESKWSLIADAMSGSAGSSAGNASGSTVTTTTSIIAGAAQVAGSSNGATKTVAVSLFPGIGVAPIDATANGVTLSVAASLIAGHSAGSAIDGSAIYEIQFNQSSTVRYQEADYDSIYSRGRRYQNGLITAGQSAWSNVFSPMSEAFDDNYGAGTGNGPTLDNGSGNVGQYAWFQTDQPIDIRGLRFAGGHTLSADQQGMWSFRGGYGVGAPEPESYALEFDAFAPQQVGDLPGSTPGTDKGTEFITTPRLGVLYSYFQFTWVANSRPEARFVEELHLKIAHSNLDGGDRRPTNGRPEKQVVFTMSSAWASKVTSGVVDAQDGLFDGVYGGSNTFNTAKNNHVSQIGAPTTFAAVSTVGSYLQFVFPRPVYFKRFMVRLDASADQEAYDSGDLPTKYGQWHWEYSKNSGSTWTACAESWSFMDGVDDMLAPRDGRSSFVIDTTDAGVGANGVTHWRMVLEQGPAFGPQVLQQFMFDLEDASGQAPAFAVHFTDDTDGTLVTFTPGPPGTPYVVAFSDGSDDGFKTASFTNIPNPVLIAHFTDEGQFDTWSDLYPSMVVQTIVNATGR